MNTTAQESQPAIFTVYAWQKLEDDPTQPRYLLTETGIGYRFQP